MEPHAALAEWEAGRLTVWAGTQTPFNMRTDLAGLFGLDERDVRVVAPPMGGSFGAKTFVRTEAVVAALARKAERPVKVVLDRAEEFVTLNRHPATIRVRIGARRDGTLVAKEVDCWVDTGAYADCGPGVATKLGYAGVGPYRIPHVRVDSLAIYTNLPPNGAYRGYGAMQSVWASERAMDVLAERLDMSPLELRRKNLLRDGDRFATGEVMHDVRFEECLQAAADAVGYEEDPRGKGLCVLLKGMQTPSRAAVTRRAHAGRLRRPLRVVRDGPGRPALDPADGRRAARLRAGPDRASRPRHRQLAVRHPHDLEPLDAHDGPGAGRGGRRPALQRRRARLRRDPQRGRPRPRHRPGRSRPRTGTRAPRRARLVDEETGQGDRRAPARRRLRGPGRQPRPGAELQNEGSLIMGLGTALFEAIDFADGQVANANLSDYNIPAPGRPAARASRTSSSSARAPTCTASARPPCRRCRRRSATRCSRSGSRVHELPITAERVLDGVDAREATR